MHPFYLVILLIFVTVAAPMPRHHKSLPYFDYMAMDNDISRTIPKRNNKPINPYNSPIYYIRLPPQPYMYVPGLGYVSQPPPPPSVAAMSPFLTLPLSFVSNGKPSTIYQWDSDAFGEKPTDIKPNKATKPVDSTIHHLEGQFTFNGKPDNVLVLRDSYNALYGDALQNFYP